MKKIKNRRQHNQRCNKSFTLKKEIGDTTIKYIKKLFRLNKWNEAIKDRVTRDIRSLFDHEEEDYCKLVREGNVWSSNYTEY